MTEYTTTDIVRYSLAGEAGKVKEAVTAVMGDKVADALNVKRASIDATWLQSQTDEEPDE